MSIDKGDRAQWAARGALLCAVALACSACSNDDTPFVDASAGKASTGGGANRGGANSGGRTGSGGSSDSGGAISDAGDSGEGGDSSEGGQSAQGGAGEVAGMGGNGTTHTGGTSAGGRSSGGTSSGGTGATAGGPPATCGNSVIEGSEQCDDGNTQALDGCSPGCKYEVVDRMTSIAIQGGTAPTGCTPTANTLGKAFGSLALTEINSGLQDSISAATLNNLLQFNGLEDPTGASNDSALSVGFLPGAPDTANGAWPGGTPLDFWFRVPATSVDAQGAALSSLAGSLTARSLSVGPGLLKLPLSIGGGQSTLAMSNARLRATVNATPAPNVPAAPPTSLASGLTVFQSLAGSGTNQGICGNVTVESLAHIPVPASLASGASTACQACNSGSRVYTACSGNSVEPGCNSMLDVLVGGCKTLSCLLTIVTAVQPDVPATGSTSVRALSLDSGNAVPSDQSTGNNDAYSSYFRFTANRAHITGLQ